MKGPEQLMEAQRLFYVAITRATDELYFYCCTQNTKTRTSRPSEFLSTIDSHIEREFIHVAVQV